MTGQVPGAVILVVPTHLDRLDNFSCAKDKCTHIIENMKKQDQCRLEDLEAEIKLLDANLNSPETLDKLMYLKSMKPHLSTCCTEQCFVRNSYFINLLI